MPPADPTRRVRRMLPAVVALLILAAAASPGTASAEGETITSLETLERVYGDPPGTEGRLRIPVIGVDAPITSNRVAQDTEVLPNPLGPNDALWYDLADWPGLGGAPGGGQNAIFSGHVNYAARVPWAGVRYSGLAVFARIGELKAGDLVEVEHRGKRYRYFVRWRRQVPADSGEWSGLFGSNVSRDSLTLYTCAGDWDAASRSYSDRIVVRAERIVGRAKPMPKPRPGEFTYGLAGTNNPFEIVRAQNFDVHTVWARDEDSGEWLMFIPGAPSVVNTLLGRLGPGDLVILKRR